VARRKVGNPLALAVLALLLEAPRHPYDMARTLKQRRKEESIKLNYGSLYTVVEQLVKAGFVVGQGTSREAARPERTVYSLTEAGREELLDWMRELVSTPHKEYRDFEAALALMGVLPPDEGERLLALRLERLRASTERQRAEMDGAVAAGLDRIHLVEGDYRLALDLAELGFVERLLVSIRTDPDFTRPWWAFHRPPGTPGEQP
jgi:DNA-binding PadR family transcriptional regulator